MVKRKPGAVHGRNFDGSDYTEDEMEFILAMYRFIKATGKKYPDARDVLGVAKSLGYRKVDESESEET